VSTPLHKFQKNFLLLLSLSLSPLNHYIVYGFFSLYNAFLVFSKNMSLLFGKNFKQGIDQDSDPVELCGTFPISTNSSPSNSRFATAVSSPVSSRVSSAFSSAVSSRRSSVVLSYAEVTKLQEKNKIEAGLAVALAALAAGREEEAADRAAKSEALSKQISTRKPKWRKRKRTEVFECSNAFHCIAFHAFSALNKQGQKPASKNPDAKKQEKRKRRKAPKRLTSNDVRCNVRAIF
jgi:hypothetical protein